MQGQTRLWRSIEWERAWKLYASEDFTNGEKLVVAWMVSNASVLEVNHAHQFIANATRISRSTVTRTMNKLVKMGAAKQAGEMRIELRHPRRNDASSVTHNGKERSTEGASVSLSNPASLATQKREEARKQLDAKYAPKYGRDWRMWYQCAMCGGDGSKFPLRHRGDKFYADIDKLVPTFECKSCVELTAVKGS